MMIRTIAKIYFIFLFFSCGVTKAKEISNQKSSIFVCKLFQKEFEIEKDGFKEFNSDLESFFKSNNKIDVLKIFMKAGNHNKSFSKRWFLHDNEWEAFYYNGDVKIEMELKDKSMKIDDLVENISKGSFMQICKYHSNMNTYLLLIKESGKVIFKYVSTSISSDDLSKSDYDKIMNAIEIFTILEEASPLSPTSKPEAARY